MFNNREISVAGKLGGQDSFESIDSFESCDRLTQSWSSQSSFNSLQRVPSYDSFDSEDYPAALHGLKPKGTFKDYVRERSDLSKDKPVIPAAALAGYTGQHYPGFICSCNKPKWVRIQINTRQKASALRHSLVPQSYTVTLLKLVLLYCLKRWWAWYNGIMLHGNFVFLNMYYGTGVVFFKVWLKKIPWYFLFGIPYYYHGIFGSTMKFHVNMI